MQRWSTYVLVKTYDVFTSVVAVWYCSAMISKLMLHEEYRPIDSLDILKRTGMNIYIIKNSFVHDALDDISALNQLKRCQIIIIPLVQ